LKIRKFTLRLLNDDEANYGIEITYSCSGLSRKTSHMYVTRAPQWSRIDYPRRAVAMILRSWMLAASKIYCSRACALRIAKAQREQKTRLVLRLSRTYYNVKWEKALNNKRDDTQCVLTTIYIPPLTIRYLLSER